MLNLWATLGLLTYVFFAAIDQFSGFEVLDQPLIVGVLLGSVLGNISLGFNIGLVMQMITLGHFPVGGSQPPNRLLHTVVAILIGFIIFPQAPLAGVILALPFGFLGQKLNMLIFKHNNRYLIQASELIDHGKLKAIGYLPIKAAIIMGLSFATVTLLGLILIMILHELIFNVFNPVSMILTHSTYALMGFGLAQLFLQLKQQNAWKELLIGIVLSFGLSLFMDTTLALLITIVLGGLFVNSKSKLPIETVEEGL
jgi:PTS system N-acetylgalactosamine-specific IIC component